MKIVINKEFFEEICRLQYTPEEVLEMTAMTEKKMNSWCASEYDGEKFMQVYTRLKYEGQVELRRHQFDLAEHSPSMAIYLGGLYLGDNATKENETPAESKLKWD
jgi:hypothetical protein